METDKQGRPIFRLPPGELIPNAVSLRTAAQRRDWGHTPLKLLECHALARGEGVRVAVLDTGADMDHNDLRGQVELSQDFTRSRVGASDVQGHGTHCAGVIAAADNGGGLLGAAPASKLLIGKVLNDEGSGYSSWIEAGVRWATENGAHVISMSLGGGSRDMGTARAIGDAVSKGIFVVCAFGNEGPGNNTGSWPGKDQNVFGVAAVDAELRVANFSSRGPEVDFACPGVKVWSTIPGNREAAYSGTSMATPYCAGIIALYLSYLKKLGLKWPTPAEMYRLMRTHAKDLDRAGFDANTGWGIPQPLAMLQAVSPPSPPVTPPPPPAGKITVILEVDPATGQSRVISSSKAGREEVPLVARERFLRFVGLTVIETMSDMQVKELALRQGFSETDLMSFAALGITPRDIIRLIKEYGDDLVNILYEIRDDYVAGNFNGFRAALTVWKYVEKYRERLGKAIKDILDLINNQQPGQPPGGGISG